MDISKEAAEDEKAQTAGRGSNQREMRAHNERLILSVLRSHGPTAKAEISRLTGMSAQTASVIMRALESDQLIERCAPVRGKVGQPSIPMKLAPEGALFFGLKIGRRSAELVLVDFLGRILDKVRLTYAYPYPDEAVAFVREAVAELTGKIPAQQRERIAGLGIAIPFYLWEWATLLGEPAEKLAVWRDRDFRQEIAELFDFPVYLENDASCACGAELVFGDQGHPRDFLYIYIGYFVGGGLVLGNGLYTGPGGNAGALGPLPVPGNGKGERQLISVASLSVLEKMILEAGGDSRDLWENTAAWRTDPALLDRWMNEAAHGLAYAIAASCSVIDFEMIVIDGSLPPQVRRDLVKLTARQLAEIDLTGLNRPEIREGSIGADARSLGAASLPLSQRFLVAQGAY